MQDHRSELQLSQWYNARSYLPTDACPTEQRQPDQVSWYVVASRDAENEPDQVSPWICSSAPEGVGYRLCVRYCPGLPGKERLVVEPCRRINDSRLSGHTIINTQTPTPVQIEVNRSRDSLQDLQASSLPPPCGQPQDKSYDILPNRPA